MAEVKAVLIVEDEVDILAFGSRMLELKGYRVFQADDSTGKAY